MAIQFPGQISGQVPGLEVVAAVEDFFAAGQGDFHLDLAVFEIQAHRDHGQAPLVHLGLQAGQFGGVQKQLARPLGIMP